MTALLIATRNAHKVREIQEVLGRDRQYLTLNDFPAAPLVVEDGETFAANAVKKADSLASWLVAHPDSVLRKLNPPDTPLYIMADDSGLEVDALNGAPGVHSARFAAMEVSGAGNSPDAANNARLLRLLENVPISQRNGRFRCVLAIRRLLFASVTRKFVVSPGGAAVVFEGVCEGRILRGPAGQGGFGYDPLFVPNGFAQSFAELGAEVKNGLSHRAIALEKLKRHLGK